MPKLLDITEVIDTTSISKHNNTKNQSNFITSLQPRKKNSQKKLVKFTKDKPLHKFKGRTLSLEVFREVFSEDLDLKRKIEI